MPSKKMSEEEIREIRAYMINKIFVVPHSSITIITIP